MRKLMWFTLGFAAACGLCGYLWVTEGLVLPAVALGILFVALAIGGRRRKPLRAAAALALGCAVGLGWFQAYSANYLSLAAPLDGNIADVTAQCTDYSYETQYGTAVEALLYLEGKPFRAKLYVSGKIDMEPGDILTGGFRFRVTTPDGSDEVTAYQGKGIFLLGYQEEDAELAKLADPPRWASAATLRKNLKETIDEAFPEDTAGFAKALLLGDRSGIDYETDTAFKISGISHIIAVSGLHVTILFTLICGATFRRRWLTALLGIPTLIFFAAVAGFSPSVVRASIMMCLMLLAAVLNREYDGPTELAFSCLVMLAVNPLVIISVSFQLSVGCMAGIFLFQKSLYEWILARIGHQGRFKKLRRGFAGSVSVTLSAMTLTTPLVAYYFGTVSLVGVLTNLLILWVISFIFYGIMLVCFLGAFWASGASLTARVISVPIRYVLVTAKTLASFPLAAVYTASIYIVFWLVFCYLLLALFLLSRNKRPGVLLCCGVLSLCLCLGLSWLEPGMDSLRMTVLDVGQGQCILLQSEGKTWMVDCGGSDGEEAADRAAEELQSMGIFRLDGIILTHYDEDHSGGLPGLLSRIPTDTLYLPESEDEAGVGEMLEDLTDGTVYRVRENLLLTYGDTKLTVFGPLVPDSGNESSLAVLFQGENCDILITGDRSGFGERMLLKTAELPELEVLVVGHHGSKYAACQELLEATNPAMAVISVGENPYGHPSQEVLDRLEDAGCAVYRTDRDGNITFRR